MEPLLCHVVTHVVKSLGASLKVLLTREREEGVSYEFRQVGHIFENLRI